MKARSLALAWIGGPVAAHLLVAIASGRFWPGDWNSEMTVIAVMLAVCAGLALAVASEEAGNAGA